MPDNNLTNRPLSVDIDLNTKAVQEQTQIIVNSFNNIGDSINIITKQLHTLSVNVGNMFATMRKEANGTAKTFSKAFATFQQTGKLTSPIVRTAKQQGNLRVFNQAKRNVVVDTELNNANYVATREQKLILDYQRKQIDNELKIKNGLVKVKDETKKVSNETQNTTKSTTNWLHSLSRIGITIASFKRLGQIVGDLVQESGSWIENLNLFEVTFGSNYKETLDWSIEFAENLGFAVNEMVKFTGLFKQLSTSIGIADETGDELAKTLTSIGTDITSFYNLDSVTTAMEKLQAGIFSGQTKPLRSIGIDVTQQTIDNLLETNEALAQFNTTSRKLDQSQKAIARTIIVLQSAKNSFGDTQKTINSLSNQIRVFQGSLQNLKLALGDTFSEPFRKALVYVNGFIMAITDIIRVFFKLTTSTGNPLPEDNVIGGINDELDEYEEKQGLLSFDKFNVASTGEPEGDLAITEALTEELNKQIEEYNRIKETMNGINNEAVAIAESIKNWFVVVDENDDFVELTAQAKGLIAVLSGIAATGFITYIRNILKEVDRLTILGQTDKITTGMKLLQKAFTPIGITIMAIAAVVIYMYRTNENFRNSVNNLIEVLLKLVSTILEPIVNILNILTPILAKLINVVAEVLAFVINIIAKIIEFIDELHLLDGAIYLVIGAFTIFGAAIIALKIIDLVKKIKTLITTIKTLGTSIITFGKNMAKFMISPTALAIAGVALLAINIGTLIHSWDNMEGWQKAVGIIGAVAGAILLVVSAIAAFHGTWTMGTAIAAITAGLVAAGAAIAVFWSNAKKEANNTIEFSGAYAKGGKPRTGSLFYANENGAELLTNFNGQNYVNNEEQVTDMLFRANLKARQMANSIGGGNDVNVKVAFDIQGNALARAMNPYIKNENARGGNR